MILDDGDGNLAAVVLVIDETFLRLELDFANKPAAVGGQRRDKDELAERRETVSVKEGCKKPVENAHIIVMVAARLAEKLSEPGEAQRIGIVARIRHNPENAGVLVAAAATNVGHFARRERFVQDFNLGASVGE